MKSSEVSDGVISGLRDRENLLIITDSPKMAEDLKDCYNVVLLSEKNPGEMKAVFRDGFGLLEAWKYGDFREILKAIGREFNLSLNGIGRDGIDTMKIIGITSISGGVGATAIATAIGKIMYREGEKPLYVSLAPVNAEGQGKDMTNLLYDIKRKRDIQLPLYISSLNGLDAIGTPMINAYSHLIDREVIEKIGEAAERAGYNRLILDIGNLLDGKNSEIVDMADFEVMIFPADGNFLENHEEILETFGDRGKTRTFTVLNDSRGRLKPEDEEYLDEEVSSLDCIIPFVGEINERSLDTEFGNEIRFLLNKIGEENDRRKMFS